MLRSSLLKLTLTVSILCIATFSFASPNNSNRPDLEEALELGLKSPGKVIDLAPYRDPSMAIPKKGEVDAKTRMQVDKSFGRMPLLFEKNEGQVSDEVKFLSRGRGYNFYLTSTEAVLVLSKKVSGNRENPERFINTSEANKSESSVIRIKLIDSNPDSKIFGQEEQITKKNYLIGNDKSKWRTKVTSFGKVRYKEVYPGIDLVFYGNQRKLEYDFIVKPGADPNEINLEYEGEDSITVDWDGNLRLKTKIGEIVEKAPIIYQETNGKRKPIDGKYVLAENKVSFKLDKYDNEKELVIDPVLEFSTYLGGIGIENPWRIVVGSSGNIYVGGSTSSASFPSLNAFQSSFGGGAQDTFVSKFDASGTLVFSTYLGGAVDDFFRDLDVDLSGNIYVTGSTTSADFPTLNAFQNIYGGNSEAFIAKFDSFGSLIFSTFYGGFSEETAWDIAEDGMGNAYITGNTSSLNFPTLNAYQNSYGGNTDTFVAKFNSSGALLFSTYLGGSGPDADSEIITDQMGNLYVTGLTRSANFPTLNATQNTYGGGDRGGDAFLTKFNSSGSPVFSTYLGGAVDDFIRGRDLDSAGNIYVTGETNSTNFPTLNAFQSSYGGGPKDAFLTKFDSSGSLIFSTYLGGLGDDRFVKSKGLAIDSSDNVYAAGFTSSINFPTLNAFQSSYGGGLRDAFVTKFNSSGGLTFSTYLGGTDSEIPSEYSVDSSGNFYVIGTTSSPNFPTLNAIQSFVGGQDDVFVSIFDSSESLVFSTYFGGTKADEAIDIDIDNSGNIFVTGQAHSTDFPTLNAFQSSNGGGLRDAFVAKIFVDTIPLGLPFSLNDFDRDGDSDVLAEFTGGLLFSFLIENSVFQSIGFLAQADPAAGWTVNATGDFNGDKKADLLLYNTTTGEYRTILLDGTSVLSDTVVFTIDPAIGVEPRGVGDFDGDGEVEIIIYHPPSGFTGLVYLVNGAFSSFEEATTIDVAGNWTLQDTGYFNGDNKTDLLISNTVTGESAVIEMDGSTASGPTSVFTFDPATGWSVIDTGDFNGDGKSDVLILHSTGALGVLVMDDLVFQSFYVPGGLSPGWELVNVGNYDGINKADFLIHDTNTGDLMTAVQDGTTITSYTPVLNLGVGSGWSYHGGKP